MTPRADAFDEDGLDEDEAPLTHLDDDSYEEFLSREFDRSGRPRSGPRVGLWIAILVAILAAAAVVMLR